MSAEIKSALIQYNRAMDALEEAEKAVQAALHNIKEVAKVATIEVDGQFFQVRERREKLYLCELNGKPKGRPLGSKKKKPEELATEPSSDGVGGVDAAVVPESVAVLEVTGVHRIDGAVNFINVEATITNDSTEQTAVAGA
jgi:hypothetical protein